MSWSHGKRLQMVVHVCSIAQVIARTVDVASSTARGAGLICRELVVPLESASPVWPVRLDNEPLFDIVTRVAVGGKESER